MKKDPTEFRKRFAAWKDGKDPYRYLYDDRTGKWNRITNDDAADVFADFVATPQGNRSTFSMYENTPNPTLPVSKNESVVPDNTLWTRQQVLKANNTRTWRSDVADVMHSIGEGAMLASTFAAPEIEPLVYPTYQMAKLVATNVIKNEFAPAIISSMMKPSVNKMPSVINRFRNQEWSNFLATKNGDYYYRMNVDSKPFSDKEKYFLSHTTPWEEFSGKGTEFPIGQTVLYEFPTKTFGNLKSTTNTGLKTPNSVIDMGKNHLLYGNTSSGKRDFVRILSDKDANLLEIDPYKVGVLDRPLRFNGLYDLNPIYEDIYTGNQTTIKGRRLNEALHDTEYNIYNKTESGIQKEIRNYGKYSGIKFDKNNPLNDLLSVLKLDEMLGEYVGSGAERLVFTDRRYPGRLIKIGGGINGQEKIQDFDSLKDAVEYTMEMNRLPGVAPILYEGFILEGFDLIPWFSLKLVYPMKSIADPFNVFTKPYILPNGKRVTGKLSAIRKIDTDKIFKPLGYNKIITSPGRFYIKDYPHTVTDLGLKNVGFDKDGNVIIFDPLIEL